MPKINQFGEFEGDGDHEFDDNKRGTHLPPSLGDRSAFILRDFLSRSTNTELLEAAAIDPNKVDAGEKQLVQKEFEKRFGNGKSDGRSSELR
jgi:hypothetical protein